MDEPHPCYKRILLKLSGEALRGDEDSCISRTVITNIAREIKQVHDLGVEIAVVTGGGNFFRGDRDNNLDLDRAAADYMGMLATIINGIALRDVLEKKGLQARLVSALEIKAVAEPFMRRSVLRYLEDRQVVIFAAGTGNPYFTTDTAAALRAIEIKADVFFKATMVDGAYSHDPKKIKNSTKFDRISYQEVLDKKLKVLDTTAVTLCQENHLPIKIFNITQKGNIFKAITDEHIGTTIC
ncbi:MAG: UMP kinase [Candidatus Aminicenantes bacterium]|nr:MAG: UMP kinase [Candidatus Aminicenantes bacterium]